MEPDRSPSKRPEWNLLLGGKHRDRLGYTWLELGRLDDDGQEHFFTVGCGLHAVKDRGKVDAWFFTTDKRVDQHFGLVRDRVPHNKAKLAEALGDDGVIYKTRGEYCRAIDDRLFRLRDRYRALVDLLIQLRVRQLSRDFDEKRISAQLSDALPPLAQEILDQVAGAMRDLDEQRGRLEGMRRSAVAVERFEKHYAGYLQVALKRRVNDFFVEHNKYDRTQRKINDDTRLLEQANQRYESAESAIAKNRNDAAAIDARLRVLRQSPKMKDARRLEDFRQRRDQSEKQAEAAVVRLNEDEKAHQSAQKRLRTTAEQWKFDRRRADATLAEMIARETPLKIAQALKDCRGNDEPAGTRMLDRVGKMIDQCDAGAQQLRKQQKFVEQADRNLQRAMDQRGQRERLADDARSRVERAVEQLGRTRDALCQSWLAWRDEASQLLPSLTTREAMQQQIGWPATSDGDDDDGFANPSFDLHQSVQAALDVAASAAQENRATLASKRSDGEAKLGQMQAKVAELESGVHVPPDPLPTRDAGARVSRPGAPLYELVDFAASVPAEEHAAWEAGLEASGLLDAWVLPQARTGDSWPLVISDEAIGDAFAMDPKARPTSNMAQVLVVSNELPDGVTSDQVQSLLQSLGCGHGQSATWFDRDGSWQVGARVGVWEKDFAGHIGITARERRRAEAIERVRVEIETQQGELVELRQQQVAADETLRACNEFWTKSPRANCVRKHLKGKKTNCDRNCSKQHVSNRESRPVWNRLAKRLKPMIKTDASVSPRCNRRSRTAW